MYKCFDDKVIIFHITIIITAILGYIIHLIVKMIQRLFLGKNKNLYSQSSADVEVMDVNFKQKVFDIYKDVQIAWMNLDLEPVRGLLTDEMYNMYKLQLLTLKNKNEQNIMEDIEYVNAKVIRVDEIDGKEEIDVMLEVTCKDYIINQKTLDVVRGNKNIINGYTYQLTFIKNKNIDITKCPHCGAELNTSSSRCEYCHSIIIHETNEYVLSKKQMLHQSRR